MLKGRKFNISSHMPTSEKWPQDFIRMFTSGVLLPSTYSISSVSDLSSFYLYLDFQMVFSEKPHLFTSAFFLTAAGVVASYFCSLFVNKSQLIPSSAAPSVLKHYNRMCFITMKLYRLSF